MFKTILMPVDLEEESSWRKALPAALLHARSDGGSLTLVTVVPNFGENIVAAYFPADFAEKMPADVPSKAIVRSGSIYHEIIATAGEIGADLIVMASHRPALSDYLLGPNADRVVRHAKCSVLVVRG